MLKLKSFIFKRQFFDVCDGFFVNYTWKHQNLENTLQNSGERINDIYIGIDVFGRGCLGGGGFQCNLAFDGKFYSDLNEINFKA